MGITQDFLETYKNKAGVEVNDVKNLTKDDAIKLYKAEWDTFGFGKLDNTNAMKLIYDFSVNSDPKVAIKYLQKALNSKIRNVDIDGYIGEQTNKAINSVDEKWLIKEIQKARAEHCDSIVDKYPNQRVFIQGWFNRINDIGRKCGCDTIYESKHLK